MTDCQHRIVVIDFETCERNADGSTKPSLDYYRDNFFASDCAACYRDVDGGVTVRFAHGEDAIRGLLKEFTGDKIVAHNLPFDSGVANCRFPDVKLQWYADTMRCVQILDNGGDESEFDVEHFVNAKGEPDAKKVPISGYGLVKCMRRVLNKPSHKKEAYDWILANIPECKRGQQGKYLNRLPADIMQRYNEADVRATLELYEYCEEKFLQWDFNWRFDHELFLALAHQVVDAQIRGVLVDREQLAANIRILTTEIRLIEDTFAGTYAKEMAEIEAEKLQTKIAGLKSDRGKKKCLDRALSDSVYFKKHFAFNTGSNKQLLALFQGKLKIEPKFYTAKGTPSMKGGVIHQWGDGGLMLKARRKRLLVKQQCETLYEMSEYDGRVHFSLKVVGTKTGRAAGGRH